MYGRLSGLIELRGNNMCIFVCITASIYSDLYGAVGIYNKMCLLYLKEALVSPLFCHFLQPDPVVRKGKKKFPSLVDTMWHCNNTPAIISDMSSMPPKRRCTSLNINSALDIAQLWLGGKVLRGWQRHLVVKLIQNVSHIMKNCCVNEHNVGCKSPEQRKSWSVVFGCCTAFDSLFIPS